MEKIKSFITEKNQNTLLLVLYAVSIILGLFYIIVPIYNMTWEILGIIYLMNLAISFPILYFLSNKLNNTIQIGKRINILILLYFILVYIGMYAMMGGNIMTLFSYEIGYLENLIAYSLVWFGFFGPLGLGLLITILIRKNVSSDEFFSENKSDGRNSQTNLKKVRNFGLRFLSIANLIFVTVVGIYCACVITSQSIMSGVGITGMYIPEVSLFLAFVGFATICLFLKAINVKKYKVIAYPITLLGLIISGMCLLPFIATPIVINDAEVDFAAAFGSDWRDNIPQEVETNHLMQTPFSVPQYFLGVAPLYCKVELNTLYFNGSQSYLTQDENITLRFDAYMPLNNGLDSEGNPLPGKNSTLIRIHGGGWRVGDKGFWGMVKMNRYFAAQGYIVFDIQYGLNNSYRVDEERTPLSVKGNFSLDDMVRHIGNFTHFLAANNDKYGADLSSTFISGFSAGGHLTCVVGNAIKNGSYTDILNETLKIKGTIPFYPGNVFKTLEWSYGREEFMDPELLIDINSPPSLVYQGIQDALVSWEISESWQNVYEEVNSASENSNCSVIYFPFTGHANDMYFNGHLNLVFLYYMERFMYLYR
ncbi:MAG: alpha/beta hydrolase fold domain-containing protein [archaeon]|nr:alpha/beta hydrolase fold domain-containing protein [archaeon]